MADTAFLKLLLFSTGAGLALVSLGIFMFVYTLRVQAIAVQKHYQSLIDKWTPILEQCYWGDMPDELPQLRPSQALNFLRLWNYYHEMLESDDSGPLNWLAQRMGLDDIAFKLATQGSIHQRSTAITALGYLKAGWAWQSLTKWTLSGNLITSLSAARALVHIQPDLAVSFLMPQIITRPDWPPTRVGLILLEAGIDRVSKPLCDAILNNYPQITPQALAYLEMTHRADALPVIHALLSRTEDAELIAACLKVFAHFCEPEDAPLFRVYINHPAWPVRLQAIVGLGRVGNRATDEQRLISQLYDSEWWIRYRAAEALASLPDMTEHDMRVIRRSMTHKGGQNAIEQVLIERHLEPYRRVAT